MNATNKPILALAPMAGYTDVAFRVMCASFGATETVSEMVSARGLYHEDKKSYRLMEVHPQESGVSIQIFGSEPEIMAQAVEKSINPRNDIAAVDINMGCPVPKIVKNGEGAALMKNEDLALRVVDAVVGASNKPVSVKLRLGWDFDSLNCISLGKKLAQTGISHITLHGRTRSQLYTGHANWDMIAEMVEEVPLPILGNGDITTPQEAVQRLKESKAAGIAIGRGAVGKPWIFKQITDTLEGREPMECNLSFLMEVARKQLQIACESKGEKVGVVQMRKQLLTYVKGLPHASALKQELLAETTMDGVLAVLTQYEDSNISS